MSATKQSWKSAEYDVAAMVAAPSGVIVVDRKSKSLVCLAAADGAQRWSTAIEMIASEDGDAQLAADGRVVYTAFHGRVGAYDAASGKSLWSQLVRANTGSANPPAEGLNRVAAAGEYVVAFGDDTRASILRAATGEHLWSIYDDDVNCSLGLVHVQEGLALSYSRSNVVAYRLGDKAVEAWRYQFGTSLGAEWTALAPSLRDQRVVPGMAFAYSSERGLVALDSARGTLKWSQATHGAVSFAVGADVLVLADDAQVRGIDLASGSVRWQTSASAVTRVAPLDEQSALLLSAGQVRTLRYSDGGASDHGALALAPEDRVLAAAAAQVVLHARDRGHLFALAGGSWRDGDVSDSGGSLFDRESRDHELVAATIGPDYLVTSAKSRALSVWRVTR